MAGGGVSTGGRDQRRAPVAGTPSYTTTTSRAKYIRENTIVATTNVECSRIDVAGVVDMTARSRFDGATTA